MEDTESLDIPDIEAELSLRSPDLLSSLGRAAAARRDVAERSTRGEASSSLGRLGPDSQRRVRTLVLLEELFSDYGAPEILDYGFLVFGVCQLVEAEIAPRLSRLSLPMRSMLLRLLEDAPGPHRVVSAWADGRVPLTLGTVQILYMAWRRLLTAAPTPNGIPPLPAIFSEQLRARAFERAVATLRNDFRNPVAHGATCTLEQHEACVVLCLGATSITGWAEFGANGGEVGLLSPHLALGTESEPGTPRDN